MNQTSNLPSESIQNFFALLYGDLRHIAHRRLANCRFHVLLDTSALVHEAFLRMQRHGGVPVRDQQHFLAYASVTMRSIVVDVVRQCSTDRRGGGAEHVPLDEGDVAECLEAGTGDATIAIHSALKSLAKVDARLARVVEMRYFEGFNEMQIASLLGVSDRTVRRDWERARLMLEAIVER